MYNRCCNCGPKNVCVAGAGLANINPVTYKTTQITGARFAVEGRGGARGLHRGGGAGANPPLILTTGFSNSIFVHTKEWFEELMYVHKVW